MTRVNIVREKIIEKIKALQAALAVIDELDLGSSVPAESSPLLEGRKLNKPTKSGRSVSQETRRFYDIIAARPEIKTSEIKTQYAKMVGSTELDVTQYVERTLARLIKAGTLSRKKVEGGRGYHYKVKTPL